MRFSLFALASLVVLGSCAGDTETLDRFSRSYSAFLDVQFDTETISDVPVVNEEKEGTYWPELMGARLIPDPRTL
jgi:hypothetical protein